jgi:hypothetical protein
MARIQNRQTGVINALPFSFLGGVINYTEGEYNPIVYFPDSAQIVSDSVLVKIPISVANEFVFIGDNDTIPLDPNFGGEPPEPDPEPDPDPALQPNCDIKAEINIFPPKQLLSNGQTEFSLTIPNSLNYRIEFSTAVMGGLNVDGTPAGWVEVAKTNDVFKVRTPSSSTNPPQAQAIWTRFIGCTTQTFHAYVPMTGTENPEPPVGNGDARQDAIPWLLLNWGSGGEEVDAPQGTHEFETWGLSQPEFKSALPWFGIEIPDEQIQVDDYVGGVLQWEGDRPRKKWVTRNVDFLVTNAVMEQATEYIIQAGIQGWAFLYYANDSPLNIWRQKYKALANKRGTKAINVVYALGGGRENYGQPNTYTNSINEIANDIVQPWWVNVNKNGQNVPVLMCLIEDINSVSDRITDMNRIISASGIADAYKVIMTTFPDVSHLAGTGQYFDAWTLYYTDGATGQPFSAVRTKLQDIMNGNPNKFVPMASCGLDQRARNFMLNDVKGHFEYQDVLNNIGDMITDVQTWKNNPANGCKVVMTGVESEYTEAGKGFLPSKWINYPSNQSLDRRMIDIWKLKLNPNYVIPN